MAQLEMRNFDAPALVTVIFALHYVLFDVLSMGPLRVKHRVPYPQTAGPEEFQRALRTQQNQVEQMPGFFALMWSCAIAYDPTFAAAVGAVWVASRICYSFLYRSFTSRRQLLMLTTIPAYVCLGILAFSTIYAVIDAKLGKAPAAGITAGMICAYTMATVYHRRWLRGAR